MKNFHQQIVRSRVPGGDANQTIARDWHYEVITSFNWQEGIYETRAYTSNGFPVWPVRADDQDVILSDALRSHARMLDDLCERASEVERAKREVEPLQVREF